MNIQRRIGQTAASRLGISIFDCTGKTIKQLQHLVRAEALRREQEPTEERTLETVTRPGDKAAENRTMALDESELQIISEGSGSSEATTDPNAGAPGRVPEKDDSGFGNVDDLLRDIGILTGRPPRPSVPMTAQRHDDSVLFTISGEPEERKGGDSSVMLSLAELQRIGMERPPEAAAPAKPADAAARKKPDSSVEMSLQELQGIERQRVETERSALEEAVRREAERVAAEEAQAALREEQRRAEEAEANAREERELHEADQRLAREVDELLESFPPEETDARTGVHTLNEVQLLLYSDILPEGQARWLIPITLSGRLDEDAVLTAKVGGSPTITLAESTYYVCSESHGASKAVEAVRRGHELSLTRRPEEADIPIETDESSLGLPWKQDYITHTLEGAELTDASIVLPERMVRWLMPVPDAASSEEATRAIMRRFGNEPRLSIAGRAYFVFGSKEGFADAKWCARTGSLLQVWSEPGTDYELQSSLGGREGPGAVRVLETSEAAPGQGVPWRDEHVRYMLQGQEYVTAYAILPERSVRWLIPAPAKDMKDRVSDSIRRKFRDEPQLELAGKRYYVYDGEDGFAGARWCARTGNILNVWPQAMTDYSYEGSMGGASEAGSARAISETDWPERFYYHQMSEGELHESGALFPEGVPVLMHPVPPADTPIGSERSMLEDLPALGAQKAELAGREYFVVPLASAMVWRQMAIYCPKTRVASRDGDRIGVWEEAGAGLFSGTTFNTNPVESRGAPLPPHGGHVQPYENEMLDIEFLYKNGAGSRYLYPVPDRVADLGTETFNNLVQIAAGEARRSGQSPLISLQGRWYFALEYAYVGARLTMLEGGRIHAYPESRAGMTQHDVLSEMRQKLTRKRRESEPEFVTLPREAAQRRSIMHSFPPGKVRYLYNVDREDPTFMPRESDLIVKDGDVESVWRMADRPIPGMTIPVVREGERIIPVREEEPQRGQTASELLAALPASFPDREEPVADAGIRKAGPSQAPGRPEPTMELSVGDLMVEPPARSAPPPPRRATVQGLPLIHELQPEASEPAHQITTGEIELVTDSEAEGRAPHRSSPPPKRPTIRAFPPAPVRRPAEAAAGEEDSTPGQQLLSSEIEIVEPQAPPRGGAEASEPGVELGSSEIEIVPERREKPKGVIVKRPTPKPPSPKRGSKPAPAKEPSETIEIHTGEFELADDDEKDS